MLLGLGKRQEAIKALNEYLEVRNYFSVSFYLFFTDSQLFYVYFSKKVQSAKSEMNLNNLALRH